MQLIKLDATDSTNDYLKSALSTDSLVDFTVVATERQLKGKGQRGAKWQSEPGKNLTFSVLKRDLDLPVSDNFILNIGVSLAVFNTLKSFQVPDLSIKWPNDILSGTSKICGILIENLILGSKVTTSVLGIGLNVNQLDFDTLQNATSLKLLLGKTFNLEELLVQVVENLKVVFKKWEEEGANYLWTIYETVLFRKDKASTFEDQSGNLFMGFIRGVSKEGKLILALEDNIIKEFNFKEVQLRY